nr:retrovirus-related Pol polyprotein from transposon TNT 1-94 [Tanacetum cinerariifolium]
MYNFTNTTTPSSFAISTTFFSTNVIQDFKENSDDQVDERSSEVYLRDLEFLKSSESKTFQPKNKGLVAKIFDWDEEEVFEDEEEVFEDEEVTQVKCRDELLSLKQAKLDVVTFQIHGSEVTKLNHALQEQLKEEKRINEKWLTNSKKVSQCISEEIHHQKKKVIRGELLIDSLSKININGNAFIPSSIGYDQEMVQKTKDWVERLDLDSILLNVNTRRILVLKSQVVNKSLKTLNTHESSKDSEAEFLTPLPPLKNLQRASSSSEIMPLTFQPHSPKERPGLCNTCSSTIHFTSDHNEFDHFKRGEKILATKAREPTKKWVHKRNSPKFIVCAETHQGAYFVPGQWMFKKERIPDISYFHVFGCPVFIHNHKDHLGKFDAKADDGYFLGYSSISKAFRVYNTRRQQIEETYHVTLMKAWKPSDLDISYYVIPFGQSLTELTLENHVPEVIVPNEHDVPLTKNIEDPPDLINTTEGTHEQNIQDNQLITQPTDVPPGNNTEVSGPITEPLVHDVTQPHIPNQASTSSHPAHQDRWSRDQHIKLLNIIGNPGEGILTRSMTAKFTATSNSECLFVDFLSEIEPKKVSQALRHPGWIDAMQEELNKFYRNKVWTLVPLPYGKIAIGSKWVFRNKKYKHGTTTKNKARLVAQVQSKGITSNNCEKNPQSAKKQQLVAMSSADAEYVAAAGCCASILWMKIQLSDYDIDYKMVPIFYDNINVIAISNNSDTSKVTEIELTAHMTAVNNQRDSVSPPPLAVKPKKGKSQTVTSTSPKSQGLEASGALSKKSKRPMPNSHPLKPSMGFPSTLDEGTRKSKPLLEGIDTHPKDSGGNKQLLDRNITFMTLDEATAKTMSRFEGSLGDKDSKGNKPRADMKPLHTTDVNFLGTGAKYQADGTQSSRLRYQSLTKNKGKPSYEGDLDTQPMILSYADVRASHLFEDEAQESKEDILEAYDEMDDNPQSDETQHQSLPPHGDKPTSSTIPHPEASNTDSSSDSILKKYDNTFPIIERQVVKYIRKVSCMLFERITEDQWEKHAAVYYANLKAFIDDYYNENIAHRDQTY